VTPEQSVFGLDCRDLESPLEPLDRLVGADEDDALVPGESPLRVDRAGESRLVLDGDDATAGPLVYAGLRERRVPQTNPHERIPQTTPMKYLRIHGLW